MTRAERIITYINRQRAGRGLGPWTPPPGWKPAERKDRREARARRRERNELDALRIEHVLKVRPGSRVHYIEKRLGLSRSRVVRLLHTLGATPYPGPGWTLP